MKTNLLPVVFLFAAVLLVPANAFSSSDVQANDPEVYSGNFYPDNNKLEPDFEDLPNPMEENIKTNETVLQKAHDSLTDIIIEQNETELKDYTGPDIPFISSSIGDGYIEVGIHFIAELVGIEYDKEEILEALGITEDIPVVIYYGYVELAAARTGHSITYEKLFPTLCMPVKSGYDGACKAFATDLYPLMCTPVESGKENMCSAIVSILGVIPTPPVNPQINEASDPNTIFSDTFENLNKWTQSGREQNWEITDNWSPEAAGDGNFAQAHDCDYACTITMKNSVNLQGRQGVTLSIDRYVDRSLDRDEYLKLEAYNGRIWVQLAVWSDDNNQDTDKWHTEKFSLSSYSNSDFKIRFVTLENRGSEDVGVDNVKIIIPGVQITPITINDLESNLKDNYIKVSWDRPSYDVSKYKLYVIDNRDRIIHTEELRDYISSYKYRDGDAGYSYKFKLEVFADDRTKVFTTNVVSIPAPTYELGNISTTERDNNITISWDRPIFTVSKYEIYKVVNNHDVLVGKVSGSQNSYVFAGDAGDDYVFKVKVLYRDYRGVSQNQSFTLVSHSIDLPTCTSTQRLVGTACVDLPENFIPITDSSLCDSDERLSYGLCHPIDEEPIITTCVGTNEPTSDLNCKANAFFRVLDVLAGGLPIHIGSDHELPSSIPQLLPLHFGTISLIVNDTDGNPGMLVSSHITGKQTLNPKATVVDRVAPFSKIVGFVTQDVNVFENRTEYVADVAFMKLDTDIPILSNIIIDERNNKIPVSSKARISEVLVNTDVKLSGAVTHSEGKILNSNHKSTIRGSGNMIDYILINQAKADYDSTKGDSGAPVYQILEDGTAKYLGINAGYACIKPVYTVSDPRSNIQDSSRTGLLPDTASDVRTILHGCVTSYSFFSHWEYIQQELRLEESSPSDSQSD